MRLMCVSCSQCLSEYRGVQFTPPRQRRIPPISSIPTHLFVLLRNLYENQLAVIRTEHGDTASFQVKKDVRQRCLLSRYLFNLYTERIMWMAGLDESPRGGSTRIAGRTVNNLRYADDITQRLGKKSNRVHFNHSVPVASLGLVSTSAVAHGVTPWTSSLTRPYKIISNDDSFNFLCIV